MRGRLVYLVGPPGAGKTTLMVNATAGLQAHATTWATEERPNHKVSLTLLTDKWSALRAIEVGRRRRPFGGTDALSMSVSPVACAWIATRPFGLILGEGARLGTQVFLGAAKAAGYEICVVHLDCDLATLDRRCESRGSNQDPTWRAGARTRASNLAVWAATIGEVIHFDGSTDPDDLAKRFAEVILG